MKQKAKESAQLIDSGAHSLAHSDNTPISDRKLTGHTSRRPANRRSGTLRSRIFLFLTLTTLGASAESLFLWNQFETIQNTLQTLNIRLIPHSLRLARSVNELDVQVRDLVLVRQTQAEPSLPPPGFGRLPGGLLNLARAPSDELPSQFAALMDAWKTPFEQDRERASRVQDLNGLIEILGEIRDDAFRLQRTFDAEIRAEIQRVNQQIDKSVTSGLLGLVALILATFLFLFLVWKWTAPLKRAAQALSQPIEGPQENSVQHASHRTFDSQSLPGFIPSEIQDILSVLNTQLNTLRTQEGKLRFRETQISEQEKSILSLFSAMQYLVIHNEQLNSELILKEKLASMSEVAARLAHEIRNPLNVMHLQLEILKDELPTQQQQQVEKVLHEIQRLSDLTEKHLTATRAKFRESFHDRELIEISPLISKSIDSVRPELELRDIQITWNPPGESIKILCHPSSLQSAIWNFLKNAWEAMERSSKKHIVLQLEAVSNHRPTPQWQLRIFDTGSGFPPEQLSQPGKLFQSTKVAGSGLGLANALELLNRDKIKMELFSPSTLPSVGPGAAEQFASEVRLTGDIFVLPQQSTEDSESPTITASRHDR